MGEEPRDEGRGTDRREFLKKAGKVAFVVPAIQVLSMVPAGAQSNGSVVVTTMPSATTAPPTTTEAPCEEFIRYRVKGDWNGSSVSWDDGGVGANDCLKDSSQWDSLGNGGALGVTMVTVDTDRVQISVSGDCTIEWVGVKAGNTVCDTFDLTGQQLTSYVIGPYDAPSISHIEVIIKCCVDSE